MRTLATFLALLAATSTPFAQSINANFEVDEQGWTSHSVGYAVDSEEVVELFVGWSKMVPPLADRGGMAFFGKDHGSDLFLYIQKEVDGLSPNTNYNVVFNMDWVGRMEPSTSPVFIKISALHHEPELTDETGVMEASFKKGNVGRHSREFALIGRLTPDPLDYTFIFVRNFHNYNNAFSVNTDENGRLFLIIGVESESGDIDNIFLNTLRVLFFENGAARKISNIDPSLMRFRADKENNLVFFESDYNDDIEKVIIYTDDNHLVKLYTFSNPIAYRAFRSADLTSGTYRIEFVLNDGRIINKSYIVE